MFIVAEKESRKLRQKQDAEILWEIDGEEEEILSCKICNPIILEDAAFYNEYALKNRRTGYEFTGKIALHVLDLSYLEQVSEEERNSTLYYWACVFKAKTWKEVLAMAEQSESIKKAVVTLRELSEDEKIRLQCEARERYQMDWQSSMRTNREKGREEGRKEIILALVQKGMSIEKIAQIVGIEEAKIRKWIDEK